MSLKREFVCLADDPDANMSALCRRYDISRKTGYKWLNRYREDGEAGLRERSRRPDTSPNRTPAPIAEAVCAVRREHPSWGGRKLRGRLRAKAESGAVGIDASEVPAASTCQAIIRRRGLVGEEASEEARAFKRFEKDAPNQLWQMDFKGHFPLVGGGRCHALTVLDDHSRFALVIGACADEQAATVQDRLGAAFRRYGLPKRILCDNAPPWGVPTADEAGRPLFTRLNAWLFRLGVDVVHGQPYHPQTQGKDERFHRSLGEEVLAHQSFQDLTDCQEAFDQWRRVYNEERPHEGIDLHVPVRRYQASGRAAPEELPAVTYPSNDEVRTVSDGGQISFLGTTHYVGEAFAGEPVALRPETAPPASSDPASPDPASPDPASPDPASPDPASVWTVHYCQKHIRTLDLTPSHT